MYGFFSTLATAVLDNAGIVAMTFFVTTVLACGASYVLWKRLCQLEDRNHEMATAMLESQKGNTEALVGVNGLIAGMEKTLDNLFSLALNVIPRREQ